MNKEHSNALHRFEAQPYAPKYCKCGHAKELHAEAPEAESRVIEIDRALEKRISGERRKSVRDVLFKRDCTVRRLRDTSIPFWTEKVREEEAVYEADPFGKGHTCMMIYRERLHLMREILEELGEPVEPCSCGYCERKRKEEAK